MVDHIVVGGGHNGLVTACYLARAGLDVLVLEQSAKLGGGSRTDELLSGYRFNTHSAAHNIINSTGIVAELGLGAVGLEYREMDPFSVAVHRDGAIVRFHRSVEQTVESIREVAPEDADRYRVWMADTMPIVTAMRAGLEAGAGTGQWRRLPARAWAAGRALARNGGPVGLAQLLLLPYGRVLAQRLSSDRVRGPVSAFAAHASASPTPPGSAIYGLWQAFYHQVGQWHAVGGAQGLIDALAGRLESDGGQWRTDAAVARVTREGASVTGVELESGERISASCVVTAIDPQTALLELLDPPLSGAHAAELRATHRSNAVQMLVLLATTALPGYARARPGDCAGLQSYVDTLASLAEDSRKPRHGGCRRTRYRPTPSLPARWMTPSRHRAITPSTSRARRRRSECVVAGRRPRRNSPSG